MSNTCDACGYENPLGANFCSKCGSQLRARTDDPTIEVPPLATSSAPVEGMLVVRQGSKRGSRILLDTDLVQIGRHPEADVLLDDITVSRRHVEIVRDADGYTVADLGSLNGTYVNGEVIEGVRRLVDGDKIQIGKFKLVFMELEDDE